MKLTWKKDAAETGLRSIRRILGGTKDGDAVCCFRGGIDPYTTRTDMKAKELATIRLTTPEFGVFAFTSKCIRPLPVGVVEDHNLVRPPSYDSEMVLILSTDHK